MAEEEKKAVKKSKTATATDAKSSAEKKPVKKKAPVKKAVAEKAPAKKAVAEKAPAKKAVAEKAPAKKAPAKKAAKARMKVQQIKSPIGRDKWQRQVLIGLGLNKMHRVRDLEDTPATRGMVNKVSHLVKVITD